MKQNRIRIIAGKWRSRKIIFPNSEGLRPTPDRVRETLFNWLGPYIPETRCLDMFAGSGVLGLEALSRGATQVTFVENEPTVIAALYKNIALLQAKSTQIIEKDALAWLEKDATPFDIVFLDPPYALDLLPMLFLQLENKGWLKKDALIYFEANYPISKNVLPTTWQLVHAKKAGKIYYYLAQKNEV